MKEAVSLSKLACHDMKNVNVIQYHDAFIHNGRLCIITELCERGDLHTEIRRRAALAEYYDEGEVMEIFVQILLGVAHVHNNRIVHRDLKVCELGPFSEIWQHVVSTLSVAEQCLCGFPAVTHAVLP